MAGKMEGRLIINRTCPAKTSGDQEKEFKYFLTPKIQQAFFCGHCKIYWERNFFPSFAILIIICHGSKAPQMFVVLRNDSPHGVRQIGIVSGLFCSGIGKPFSGPSKAVLISPPSKCCADV